jgi:hypothetical protein
MSGFQGRPGASPKDTFFVKEEWLWLLPALRTCLSKVLGRIVPRAVQVNALMCGFVLQTVF